MLSVKKIWVKIVAALLAVMLLAGGTGAVSAEAAETAGTDAGKYTYKTYNYKVTDYSTVIKGKEGEVAVDCYYSLLTLPGKSKAVKKINKYLKNLKKDFSPETIIGYAETYANEANPDSVRTFYDTNYAWVVYNDGQYISVTIERYWYAGGVSNTFHDGYTFSLKNGKRAAITKATGLKFEQIKKMIVDDLSERFVIDDLVQSYIDSLTESNINYYLTNDGQCVVTFRPYDVGNAGTCYEFAFEY